MRASPHLVHIPLLQQVRMVVHQQQVLQLRKILQHQLVIQQLMHVTVLLGMEQPIQAQQHQRVYTQMQMDVIV